MLVLLAVGHAASFFGTFAPFLRASESPIAMACLRLFTVPPFPPLPDLSVPFFFLCMALFTDLPAALPYFDRWISFSNWNVSWLPLFLPLLMRSSEKKMSCASTSAAPISKRLS